MTMEQPNDAAVIASSLEDGKRFGVIFERHFPQIYRYVARRLGPEDAADVSGEVFVTAFRRRLDYDSARPDALPWLYGIATRLISNHRHAERRRLLLLSRSPGAWDPGAAFEDADARLDAQRLGPPVMDAIRRLSPGDRDALLLYAWADLSYEEIADALTIPIGTVRSRLHRARSSLKGALREHIPVSTKEGTNG
jgi:RNA polymerase sigma factor (sigma-70 family)